MTYLFLGYGVVWLAIAAYVATLHRRVAALRRDLEALGESPPRGGNSTGGAH